MSNLIEKLEEIKMVGIIKDFSVVNKPNGKIDYDIEFFNDLPPNRALFKLDMYLGEKYEKLKNAVKYSLRL